MEYFFSKEAGFHDSLQIWKSVLVLGPLQNVQQSRGDSCSLWAGHLVCGVWRHGATSLSPDKFWGEDRVLMPWGRPSLLISKTFSGNGNICRQWLQERSCGCAEDTGWPTLVLAGMDVDPTPTSSGLAVVTAHPRSPSKACVPYLSSSWGLCWYVNPVLLLHEKTLCDPRSPSMERRHL